MGPVVLAGCAFGTNRVNLAAVPSSAMPADGPTTPVEVRDARAELNGTTVGFKRNGYGAKTGSVELANKQPLAERVRSDLISVLRERGYRAGLEESAADLRFDAEILSFIVDVKQGFWSGSLEGLSAVRVTIIEQGTGRQVWSDVVRGGYEKTGLQFVSADDHQEVVEKLYASLMTNMRAAVPDMRGRTRPPTGRSPH
jgi:Uncharacterized lipoprotein